MLFRSAVISFGWHAERDVFEHRHRLEQRKMLEPLSPPLRQAVLGRALARVIAHEIYHILAETTDHADTGIAKAQMTFKDLTADGFDLSPTSLQRIRAAYRQAPAAVVPIAGLVPPGSPKR